MSDFNDSVSSDFIIGDIKDPQQLGKVLTYGRRYNLVSLFNILADEDDDAQSFYESKEVDHHHYMPRDKYDKRIFGMKELDNLRRQKDKYNYEKAMEEIKKNYSIDNEMELKVRELYGIEAKDLF